MYVCIYIYIYINIYKIYIYIYIYVHTYFSKCQGIYPYANCLFSKPQFYGLDLRTKLIFFVSITTLIQHTFQLRKQCARIVAKISDFSPFVPNAPFLYPLRTQIQYAFSTHESMWRYELLQIIFQLYFIFLTAHLDKVLKAK